MEAAMDDEYLGVRTTPTSSSKGGARSCRFPGCDGTGHRVVDRWVEGHNNQRSCPMKAGVTPPPHISEASRKRPSLSAQMAQRVAEGEAAALSSTGDETGMTTRHATQCYKRKRGEA